VNTLYLLIDSVRRMAWFHTQPLPLGDDNVVLVDRLDGVGGALAVVGKLRVPSAVAFPRRGCSTGSPGRDVELSQLVRQVVQASSAVMAFVRP
jgi:hypothetical protein